MNRYFYYAIRTAACILLLFIYLYAWRPVRRAVTEQLIRPALAHAQMQPPVKAYTVKTDGVALRITFKWNDDQKTIQYRPQAGFFFLLSLLTLILLAAPKRWFLILVSLHIISTLLTAALMLLSRNGWYAGFIGVDLIGTYLTPVLSLAIAAWASALK